MKSTIKIGIALLAVVVMSTAFRNQSPKENKDKLNYFSGTFDEALEKAKKDNKPIFLDAYTSWCGWCKELDKKTFSDQDFADYMNANFVIVKMDMESKDGKKVGQKYDVSAYPTLLVIHKNGRLAHKIEGFMKAPEMLEEVKFAEKKLKRLDGLEEK